MWTKCRWLWSGWIGSATSGSGGLEDGYGCGGLSLSLADISVDMSSAGVLGDLSEYLKSKGALKPRTAVRFGLDIARGMSYLHEIKPEPIIHRDLEPSNVLRDDTGHLKVADFGLSKILKAVKGVEGDRPVTPEDTSCKSSLIGMAGTWLQSCSKMKNMIQKMIYFRLL
ncbi:Serine/threonine-protein kinase 12-like protein [Drosera capensis]